MLEALTMWPLYASPVLMFGVPLLWWPLWLAIYFLFRRFFKSERLKRNLWRLFCVFIAILPISDSLVLSYGFNYLCATQEGEHIYQTVDDVEGLLVYERESMADMYLRFGYRYIEAVYKEEDPIVMTLEGYEDAQSYGLVVDEQTQSKWMIDESSKYLKVRSVEKENFNSEYEYLYHTEKLFNVYSVRKDQVKTYPKGELLAEVKRFYFYGGMLDRYYIGLTASCPNRDIYFHIGEFLKKVLTPINYY